ncbi:ankyrin repeat-containing domain protein, partial [Jimgerdemannia flammicorona]
MNPYRRKAPTDPTSDNTNVAIAIPPLTFYEDGRDGILCKWLEEQGFSPEKTISDYLTHSSSTDTTRYSPLHIAARKNATHIIIILIHELNADIDAIGYGAVSALYVAAKHGCYDAVRLLCRYGASTAAQNFTLKSPLQIAACNGHHKVVSFLCTSATRRNRQNALYYACEGGHVDTVRALLEFGGINVNARTWMGGRSALHICVYHGHLQL